jgi:hypothetical protein
MLLFAKFGFTKWDKAVIPQNSHHSHPASPPYRHAAFCEIWRSQMRQNVNAAKHSP